MSVEAEIKRSHRFLSSRPASCFSAHLPVLTVLTARCGKYKSDFVRTVATALELLNLAAAEHYLNCSDDFDKVALIAGDYWYGRAMCIASSLNLPRINSILAEAIFDIASAEDSLTSAKDQQGDGYLDILVKRGALYRAACQIGALLSQNEEKARDYFTKLGSKMALLSQLSERLTKGLEEEVGLWRGKTKEVLDSLGTGKYETLLEQLTGEINST